MTLEGWSFLIGWLGGALAGGMGILAWVIHRYGLPKG